MKQMKQWGIAAEPRGVDVVSGRKYVRKAPCQRWLTATNSRPQSSQTELLTVDRFPIPWCR
jgi:hypothetical protein